MGSGYASQRDISDAHRGTKKVRYVPHQSDTSEAIASSFIEFSHTLEDFRAGLR